MEQPGLFDDVEAWRVLIDRDGSVLSEQYEVSTHGRVRSWKRSRGLPGRSARPRYLKGNRQRYGHTAMVVMLPAGESRNVFFHQLVAWAFLGPEPSTGPLVRHLDGDPTNNHVANLRYGTHRDNWADNFRDGVMGWVPSGAVPFYLRPEEIADLERLASGDPSGTLAALVERARDGAERHADL